MRNLKKQVKLINLNKPKVIPQPLEEYFYRGKEPKPHSDAVVTQNFKPHYLSVAEQHFVKSMIPRAFQNKNYEEKAKEVAEVPVSTGLRSILEKTTNSWPRCLTYTSNPNFEERMNQMQKILSMEFCENRMTKFWNIQRSIELFRRSPGDTGSPEVQVAVLTQRIKGLESHMASHKKDFSTRRQLFILRSKRHKVMKYLRSIDLGAYHMLQKKLGFEHDVFNNTG